MRQGNSAGGALLAAALLLAVAFLLVSYVRTVAEINWSSLSVLHYVIDSGYHDLPVAPPSVHPRSLVWSAIAALREGRPEEALASLELQEQRSRILVEIAAQAHMDLGDYSEAVRLWGSVENDDALLRMARAATQHGELSVARYALQSAWEIDPHAHTASLVKLLLQHFPQDPGVSETALRYSIDRFPSSPFRCEWFLLLGNVLTAQERTAEAERAYRDAIAENPDSWPAYIALGWLYFDGQDSAKARAQFEHVIELGAPEQGYRSIGSMLVRLGEYAEADEWLRRAIELRPDSESWYLLRASAAQQAGNLPLALAVYQDALRRFPDHPPLHYEIAEYYLGTGQIEEAIAAIDRAIELAPHQSGYFALAGRIFEVSGDRIAALDAYRQALRLTPGSQGLHRAVERLSNP